MCMICNDYNADKLTAQEAFSNLDEMVRCGDISEEHGVYIIGLVLKNEMELIEDDLEITLDDLFI